MSLWHIHILLFFNYFLICCHYNILHSQLVYTLEPATFLRSPDFFHWRIVLESNSLAEFANCYYCYVTSVVSNSVQPSVQRQPTRLPCPRDSPGKNTGVGCHFLLQCMKLKSESEVAQSCPTPSDLMHHKPTRLLRPWDFPGKSTGVGCHCLLLGCHYF